MGIRTLTPDPTPAACLKLRLDLVPLLPRTKTPFRADQCDPVTGWRVVIDNADAWRNFRARHPRCNVALIWPGCQVDLDSEDADRWARERGVPGGTYWAIRTGRGVRYLYAALPECPSTFIDASHAFADLLAPGSLALVPPSIHPNGTRYEWIPGHRPADIPFDDLDTPPTAIVDAWHTLKASVPKRSITRTDAAPGWLGLVFDAICDHLAGSGRRIHERGDGAFTTTCPFHDDRHPSLSVHPERGWKCFAGCGEGRLTSLAVRLGITNV